MSKEILKQFIKDLIDNADINHESLKNLKREFSKTHALSDVPSNVDLLSIYHELLQDGSIQKNQNLENVLKKRAIRSMSGIVSVQVLTKPFWCPGKCIFCPNDFTMPKSYINTEPGAMRALLNQFDPYKQVYNRLMSLKMTGHATDKIEMIVLGGTRDVYPQDYKTDFVKGLYDACNTFDAYVAYAQSNNIKSTAHVDLKNFAISYPETLEESLRINQTVSSHRIIGLTVETRPEYVTDENCQYWTTLGVTRIEMGIQNCFDDVLDANKRGHTVDQARQAMHRLRQYGFKISVHMMPGLYGSTYEKDLQSFEILYSDPFFKPDEIKFYPTSVIPNTELYDLYIKGEYKPLDTATIQRLIREVFSRVIPPYTRIKRLIRDIPSTEIVAWSSVTNLSQLTHEELLQQLYLDPSKRGLYQRLYEQRHDRESVEMISSLDLMQPWTRTYIIDGKVDADSYRHFVSLDTRSREIRHKTLQEKKSDEQSFLVIRVYDSSLGKECFVAVEDGLGYVYGFTRLLLPKSDTTVIYEWLGKGIAMIRELHVYGQVAKISEHGTDTQHKGIGTLLMETAEYLTKKTCYHALSVISGVGVRQYYEKLGYALQWTYMVKHF